MSIELRVLPLSHLKPAPYNPRKPLDTDSAAYRKLRASLAEFGLVEPLVWNELTGHVVGGHARLRILADLGATEVPVSVVRLTDAREKALNVVLNNQEAQGRYDPSKLAELLAELEDVPELELTGFDTQTMSALRLEPAAATGVAAGTGAQPDPDRVEVTLVTDAATYESLAADLNALVGKYDLVSHVRRGTTS